MAGPRDNGTSAENKAHDIRRRPPTPLENWNRYKTQAEKDKDRFRGYAQEITQSGGNPDALSSPYLDPYDYEEPDQSWRTIK
jgi:hypothetical protein